MILLIIIFIAILILVHEFGHFLLAKNFKVKVEEFGIGFPPRIFKFKKDETIYSFNLIPLGGFVRLYGENEKTGSLDSFSDQPPKNRLFIVLAGIVFNIFLAYFIFSFISLTGFIKPIFDNSPGNLMIFDVASSSPAKIAGLEKGDFILGFSNFKEFKNFINENLGKEIELKIKRKNDIFTVKLVPRIDFPKNEGAIGVSIFTVDYIKEKFPLNFVYGARLTFDYLSQMFSKIYEIFKNLITVKKVPQDVVGPVGIFKILLNLKDFGIKYLIFVFGVLSLNLAVINILPFPALDGGRLIFILFEMLSGKEVNKNVESIFHLIGFVILILIAILVTIRDVRIFIL
jgi:regulator of sigma E protease